MSKLDQIRELGQRRLATLEDDTRRHQEPPPKLLKLVPGEVCPACGQIVVEHEPWKALGISRATYFRKKKPDEKAKAED